MPDGRTGTVKDENGVVIRFATKREAKKAADDVETDIRRGHWRDTSLAQETFAAYATRWYADLDLAASTMQNYRHHLEEHLLPFFGTMPLASIRPSHVARWEKAENEVYAVASVQTWRGTLHNLLESAVEERLIDVNPARRRRGRGKRAGRTRRSMPPKVITDALGALLIAERTALLAGRDDEFVATILTFYTGLRWGELVGLEKKFVLAKNIAVNWQLYELDSGEIVRCPPKDDSIREIDMPEFLSLLLSEHIQRTDPRPCTCHGYTYIFRAHGAARATSGRRKAGPLLADIARHAKVSVGTVSNVLNHPERVREATRLRVEKALAELEFTPTAEPLDHAPHWRRNGFATWLFTPAASGWFPQKAPYDARPVPVSGMVFPGTPIRGRNASSRADSCWRPIAAKMTPHGLRHAHATTMEDLGTPKSLRDERMGHLDGSVSARYTQPKPEQRVRLCADLTDLWAAALEARQVMHPRSPVAVLDGLLRAV